jgi:transcription termination factor NusB
MTEHADGYMLVTDDSGVAVMYDCSLADIQVLEQELLKLVSFYINSSGSTVDRFVIIKEALECEQQFQTAKL